ncbi:MAG: hypothetical protein V2J12_08300 [Gammaproteobacteria bacterium]|jgi:hypothetical protein|nr:hypothetical protein [Gammaproteobacteria bacterium]
MIDRRNLRASRAACLSLMLVGLLQLSGWVHDLTVDHQAGESCELCVGHDRPLALTATAATAVFVVLCTLLAVGRLPSCTPRQLFPAHRARAPPVFRSIT